MTKRKVDEALVRAILTASPLLSGREVGDALGCSHQLVNHVRNGTAWRHVVPELPRPFADRRRRFGCSSCRHWSMKLGVNGGCSLEMPEAAIDPLFGRLCSAHSSESVA